MFCAVGDSNVAYTTLTNTFESTLCLSVDIRAYVYDEGYGNNNVTLSPLLDKDVRPTLISGRLFNEDELQDGAYVAVVGNKLFDGQDSFFIGDNEYKKVGIIEHEAYTKMAFVPYQAMPDNCNKIAYLLYI